MAIEALPTTCIHAESIPTECGVWHMASFDMLATAFDAVPDILSQGERRRRAGYKFRDDADRYTLSHMFLRLVLVWARSPNLQGAALYDQARALVFGRSEFGKPVLQDESRAAPAFSLSRSQTAVAVAVAWNVDVGIDVESQESRRHMTPQLMNFAFSQAERRNFSLHGPPEDDALQLWTRKEAILKADGRGLQAAPCRIETALTDDRPLALPESLGDLACWGVRTRIVGSEVVSTAVRR